MPSKTQYEINKLRGEVSKDDKISNDNIKLLRKALTNAEIAIKALHSEDKDNSTKINQAIAIANRALSSTNSSIKNSGNQTINGNLTVTSFRILGTSIYYNTITSYENIILAGNKTVDGRDLSVDGTKLDSIDTGADVTSSNPPQTHGASVHSDRVRSIWLSAPYYTGGNPAAYSYGIPLPAAGTTQCNYQFIVPTDFVSLSHIYVYYTGSETGNWVLDVYCKYGALNASQSQHSENDLDNIIGIPTANIIYRHEIIGLTSVAIGDQGTIWLFRDGNNASDVNTNNINIRGILIEYTADM